MVTTNANGQVATEVVVEPAAITGNVNSASEVTSTKVGPDGE